MRRNIPTSWCPSLPSVAGEKQDRKAEASLAAELPGPSRAAQKRAALSLLPRCLGTELLKVDPLPPGLHPVCFPFPISFLRLIADLILATHIQWDLSSWEMEGKGEEGRAEEGLN